MNIWSRLGVSVAIAAIFCIVATESLQGRAFYEIYKWHICAALLSAGAVLWVLGRAMNAKFARRRAATQEPRDPAATEEDADNGQPFLLFNLAYWGSMLVVFGAIICFIAPLRGSRVEVVTARTPRKAAPPPDTHSNLPPETALTTTTNPPATFLPMKLQGVTYRRFKPSALINGRTYIVGDYVGEAKVVSIDAQRAVLELDGSFKVLELAK